MNNKRSFLANVPVCQLTVELRLWWEKWQNKPQFLSINERRGSSKKLAPDLVLFLHISEISIRFGGIKNNPLLSKTLIFQSGMKRNCTYLGLRTKSRPRVINKSPKNTSSKFFLLLIPDLQIYSFKSRSRKIWFRLQWFCESANFQTFQWGCYRTFLFPYPRYFLLTLKCIVRAALRISHVANKKSNGGKVFCLQETVYYLREKNSIWNSLPILSMTLH